MIASYGLLGVAVASAAFLAVNIAVSTLVMLATVIVTWRSTLGVSMGGTKLRIGAVSQSAQRATLLFLLRIAPALLTIAIVALLCVPSYLKYEPGHTSERIGPMLALLAFAALSMTMAVLWRTVKCWRATRRLARHWRRGARTLDLQARKPTSWQFPAYRFEHPFPVVAVVGAVHPKLFVSNIVIDVLSDDELEAAVAHERAHVTAADNFKRALMGSACDVFGLSRLARRLDRLWFEASESAADEAVARRSRNSALSLASALIKISRLIPPGATPALSIAPAAAFLVAPDDVHDNAQAGVVSRVRRLVEFADTIPERAAQAESSATYACSPGCGAVTISSTFRLRLMLVGGVLLLAMSTAALSPRMLATTHNVIEQVLTLLD